MPTPDINATPSPELRHLLARYAAWRDSFTSVVRYDLRMA